MFLHGAGRSEGLSARQKALGQARVEAARASFERHWKEYLSGELLATDVYTWSCHILDSQRDLAAADGERATAIADHLARMNTLKKTFERTGPHKDNISQSARLAVDYWVKEAEFWASVSR